MSQTSKLWIALAAVMVAAMIGAGGLDQEPRGSGGGAARSSSSGSSSSFSSSNEVGRSSNEADRCMERSLRQFESLYGTPTASERANMRAVCDMSGAEVNEAIGLGR
jgi:hypothetical protein